MDSLQHEMFVPELPAWAEQFCYLTGLRIDPREVCAFVQIAINAGKSEIVEIVCSAMYFWNDVLNVERRPRRIILMQMTILADVVCTLSNVCSKLSVDHLANW